MWELETACRNLSMRFLLPASQRLWFATAQLQLLELFSLKAAHSKWCLQLLQGVSCRRFCSKGRAKTPKWKSAAVLHIQAYPRSSLSVEAQVHVLISSGVQEITGTVLGKSPLSATYLLNFSRKQILTARYLDRVRTVPYGILDTQSNEHRVFFPLALVSKFCFILLLFP